MRFIAFLGCFHFLYRIYFDNDDYFLILFNNLLSCARSFRNVSDDALIKNGEERAEISCRFTGSYSGKVEAALLKNGGRTIKVNSLPVKRVGDMIGRVNTVVHGLRFSART